MTLLVTRNESMCSSRWMSWSDVTPLHNLAAQCSSFLWTSLDLIVFFFFLFVTNFFLDIVTSPSVFAFSSSVFQYHSNVRCTIPTLTCSSTRADFLDDSLLSATQQCRILMKALRNSMLKVVYMMGLTALFRYPSQVTALYREGEMQQLLQWAFSTWVRKKGNQQMMNTPWKQKKQSGLVNQTGQIFGNSFCQSYFTDLKTENGLKENIKWIEQTP